MAYVTGFFTHYLMVEDFSKPIAGQGPETERETSIFFDILVDYDLSLEQSFPKGYDIVPLEMNEKNFPKRHGEQGRQKATFKIFHSDLMHEPGEILIDMEELGFRPATIRELCAFAQKNSLSIRRWFPLAALASPWIDRKGNAHVPVIGLYGDRKTPFLHLDLTESIARGGCNFLAVKQEKAD
ncbi:MAG: hypothetical protein A3D44_02955 [Candidatus Staskawiczbacteria bacterium RIFCSPHIGHO2_02_FULL_42_22]|uniref:Uncharacterized protein n=1 Tax=Candidatus Staskawiczbacteria bacterium RIFCSPHIGHO2_02_FULL_42_22 TaxID=1802207 RepID=A0A1G2I4P9_9BACT|nr:MAG: hypothetical protein A3D44_02955 [Candidatus Staskawiczbacteria bacterium RIFCSPHIGHO2_02_FULL_42_22]